MRTALVVTIFFGLLPLFSTAWADDSGGARAHFKAGTRHFDLNEFEAALADFKEGYRLKDDPVFLYNIAQCHRLLHQNSEAIRFYRSYLRRAADAPNRAEVESKIAALQQALDLDEKATKMPPNQTLPEGARPAGVEGATAPAVTVTAPARAPEPAKSANQPLYKKWWLWTAVGVVLVAGVGIGVGVAVGGSTRSSANTFGTVTF